MPLFKSKFRDNVSSLCLLMMTVVWMPTGVDSALKLRDLDGTDGMIMNGVESSDQAGISVSSAGDFNGDGYVDLMVGAPFAGDNGESYLIL